MKNIKMISFILVFLLVSVGFGIYSMQADDTENQCKYEDKINKCIEANKNGTTREISDFVCIDSTSKEQITYNIVLDSKFREIDEKVEKYLDSLYENKTEYFGLNSTKTMFDAITDINNIFGSPETGFYKEYFDICSDNIVVKETLSCGTGTVISSKDFLVNNYGENICLELANTKLGVFKEVAINILKLNKKQVKDDYFKKYTQEQRKLFDDLIDKMSINRNYVNKIDQKWNGYTSKDGAQ